MEVDEVPRSIGRFNLDRVAQKDMYEGLEAWTIPEPVPSVRGLETKPIRPLMEIALPGYTSSSTGGSQTGRVHHVSRSYKRGCSQRLATIQRERIPPGEVIQSGM